MTNRKQVTQPLPLPDTPALSNSSLRSTSLSPSGLILDLASDYCQNNDAGVISNWFKKKKINSQGEVLASILGVVQEARGLSSNLLEFKSELLTQEKRLRELILLKQDEAQFAVDRQRETQASFVSQEESNRQSNVLRVQKERLENERISLENQIIYWEAKQNKQKSKLLKLKGKCVAKIIKGLDFTNMDMKQVLVLIETLKEAESKVDVLSAFARWEEMKAEAEIKKAMAKQEKTKAKHEKWKFDIDKEDLEKDEL